MSGRLFFIDRMAGIRKTYSDFAADVNAIRSVPNLYSADDQYRLITTLVAALCCNQDIALNQRLHSNSVYAESDLVPVQPNLQPSELWSSIATSTSNVGVFTSGTTGRAKLIQHRMETLARSVRKTPHHHDDVWGLTYHPATFAGLQVLLQALCNSNPIVRLSGLESSAVHDELQRTGITHISATPTWLRLICSDGVVQEHVTHITTGGEIADRTLIDLAQTTFPNAKFRNIYASTESGSVLQSDGDLFRVPGNLANKVKVVNGVLAIHRSLLAESIRGPDINDFFLTGDCVDIVSEGPLTIRFTARRSDWINVGGNKVNPHEIEKLLVSLEGILDARVYGRKNSVTGNIVCCEVVRSSGEAIMPKDIHQRLEKLVEPLMIPRIFEFVDSIDKTPTGKKSRAE